MTKTNKTTTGFVGKRYHVLYPDPYKGMGDYIDDCFTDFMQVPQRLDTWIKRMIFRGYFMDMIKKMEEKENGNEM